MTAVIHWRSTAWGRKRLPNGYRHSCKLSEIKDALESLDEGEVYLDLLFYGFTRKPPHKLIEIFYAPPKENTRTDLEDWDDLPVDKYLEARVYAIPSPAWRESGYNRESLSIFLGREMRRLTSGVLPSRRFEISIELAPAEKCLKSVSTVWTGIRKEPEYVRLVSLANPSFPIMTGREKFPDFRFRT